MGSTNSSSGNQSSQSQTSYDPQLKAAFLGNYANAQDLVSKNPGGQAYTGPLSADFSGTSLPQAQQGFSALAGFSAPQVDRSSIRTINPGQLSNTDLSAYMNPYTNDVVNTTAADLSRQYGIDSTAANAQATQAGAFGGSRSAVLSSLVNDNYQRNLDSTLAGLRQAGFTQAQGAAQSDIGTRLAADTANAGYDASTAAANQGAALQGAGIRQGANTSLAQAGQAQQQQKQSAFEAAYQEWLRQQNNPLVLQQLLNQSAGLLPNGTVGTGSSTGTTKSSGFSITPPSVSIGG
jgi:hypothetical protein